jgi:cell division protein FtsQ
LLDAAGELRSKIRAGILVGERRWTLKLTNGLDVKLPEQNPQAAVGQFVRLAREMRLLDKDILAVDLRLPGRLNVRLSDEAYGARLEALARKKPKGGAI